MIEVSNANIALLGAELEISAANTAAAAALLDGEFPVTRQNIQIAHQLLHPAEGGQPLRVNALTIEAVKALQGTQHPMTRTNIALQISGVGFSALNREVMMTFQEVLGAR